MTVALTPLTIEPIVDLDEAWESELAAEEEPPEDILGLFEESDEELEYKIIPDDSDDTEERPLTIMELRERAYENYLITLEVLEQGPGHEDYQRIVESVEQF